MSTTTHASLTDRYVAAALTGVQADQRADVAAELRVSIADAIDARTAHGESPDTAERAVLPELGDPMRLAAEYSGRPLYLIGPAFYPDYVSLLRLLLSIVVPIIAIVVGAASAVSGAGSLDVLLAALGTRLLRRRAARLLGDARVRPRSTAAAPSRAPRPRAGTSTTSRSHLTAGSVSARRWPPSPGCRC